MLCIHFHACILTPSFPSSSAVWPLGHRLHRPLSHHCVPHKTLLRHPLFSYHRRLRHPRPLHPLRVLPCRRQSLRDRRNSFQRLFQPQYSFRRAADDVEQLTATDARWREQELRAGDWDREFGGDDEAGWVVESGKLRVVRDGEWFKGESCAWMRR